MISNGRGGIHVEYGMGSFEHLFTVRTCTLFTVGCQAIFLQCVILHRLK